jgi:citrate lyase subunit beta / citryl-CoA lyase
MHRSFLFTPASALDKLPKALASGADALILDLEDAVAVQEKERARSRLLEVLARPSSLPIYVRINALTTPFSLMELLEIGAAKPAGIMLPKVEGSSDLRIADWVLGQVERKHHLTAGSIEILPIIETARGLAHAQQIACTTPRVKRLMFGAVDLALDMEIDLDAEAGAIANARFAIALASRAAELAPPLDTAFLDIKDLNRFRDSALNARRAGSVERRAFIRHKFLSQTRSSAHRQRPSRGRARSSKPSRRPSGEGPPLSLSIAA